MVGKTKLLDVQDVIQLAQRYCNQLFLCLIISVEDVRRFLR